MYSEINKDFISTLSWFLLKDNPPKIVEKNIYFEDCLGDSTKESHAGFEWQRKWNFSLKQIMKRATSLFSETCT